MDLKNVRVFLELKEIKRWINVVEFELWKKVKKILGTKSRGARLLVVGVLLISSSEIIKIIRELLNLSTSSVSYLEFIGFLCAFWGAMSYLSTE